MRLMVMVWRWIAEHEAMLTWAAVAGAGIAGVAFCAAAVGSEGATLWLAAAGLLGFTGVSLANEFAHRLTD